MFNPLNFFKYPAYILGVLFIFSGWLKGVDPMETATKIEEYLIVFNFSEYWKDWSVVFSILLAAFELFWGLMLLSLMYRKIVAMLTIAVLLLFTIITAYIAFVEPEAMADCGCFGSLFELSSMGSFIKNIVLLLLAFLYRALLIHIVEERNTKRYLVVLVISIVIAFFVPLYSYFYLPPAEYFLIPNLTYNLRTELFYWIILSVLGITYLYGLFNVHKK